jgi:predicted dinucleotide-binding enzyme
MDVSNPIAGRDGEELVRSIEQQGGAGLVTAKLLPGAHVVRAFNAIGSTQLPQLAHREGTPVGVPIAGDDKIALALAERLIKEIGFEPVVVGGLAMGKHLVPRTLLGGVHTADEIKQIAATLK